MTKKELMAKLKALGKISDDERNKVVCTFIGHSRIQTTFFGYYNCGRCEEQVGDSLGSSYLGATKAVIIGHNCETCQKNYKDCTWQDKLYAPDPFKEA